MDRRASGSYPAGAARNRSAISTFRRHVVETPSNDLVHAAQRGISDALPPVISEQGPGMAAAPNVPAEAARPVMLQSRVLSS